MDANRDSRTKGRLLATLKKMLRAIFEGCGEFRNHPPAAMLILLMFLIASAWWLVFVLPIQIPLMTLREWSMTKDKSLWACFKNNFEGPVQ